MNDHSKIMQRLLTAEDPAMSIDQGACSFLRGNCFTTMDTEKGCPRLPNDLIRLNLNSWQSKLKMMMAYLEDLEYLADS